MEEEQQQQPAESQATTDSFSVPEEYQDRGWVEKIKSPDDLWKTLDNAQSLLGKRPAGIPAKDSPQEEWDKFYQALGRPETPDSYEFENNFEGLPEDIDLGQYESKAKEFFHELGLSKEQASNAWKKYVGMEMEAVQQMHSSHAEQQAELDKQVNELTQKLYGDDFDNISQQAQEFFKGALPAEIAPVVDKLSDDPQALVAMVGLAKHAQEQISQIKKQYTGEDKLTGSGNQASTGSKEDVLSRMMEIRMQLKNADPLSKQRKELTVELEQQRKVLENLMR